MEELEKELRKLETRARRAEQRLKFEEIQAEAYRQDVEDLMQEKIDLQARLHGVLTAQTRNYEEFVLNRRKEQNRVESEEERRQRESPCRPDMQILIEKSLLELRDGIRVEWEPRTGEEWFEVQTKPALLVGFLGDFKSGKSYFLSKLAAQPYAHSITEATQGLCFVFGASECTNKIYYVDTAGSGEPLKILKNYACTEQGAEGVTRKSWHLNSEQHLQREMEEAARGLRREIDRRREELLLQKHTIEKFLQNFIIEECSVVVLIVKRLTKQQQRLIHSVHERLSASGPGKRLLIVHNLQDLYLEEEIEVQIEKDIVNCFETEVVIEQHEGERCRHWVDRSIDRRVPSLHLVYANDYLVDEGLRRRYNSYALRVIRRCIAAQNTFESINVFEKVEKYFSVHFQDYIRVDGLRQNERQLREETTYEQIAARVRARELLARENEQRYAQWLAARSGELRDLPSHEVAELYWR